MYGLRYATLLAIILSGAAHAAESADPAYIARLLYAAHERTEPFPDILRINPDLDESLLYDVQRRYVARRLNAGDRIGGYKGGFIPRAPIGGVLPGSGIVRGSPIIDSSRFQTLLVEAEIGFRLCASRTQAFADVTALRAATCAVLPAVELPDAAFEDLGALREDFQHLRRLLIPTNIAASHVLLGEAQSPAKFDLDRLDVRVLHDGEEIGFRPGATSSDDIWQRVLWTINEFVIPNGYEIRPDHVIIPGALTGLHPGKPGDYVIDYAGLGTIEFEVR